MLELLGIPITGWISSGGIIALVGLFLRRDLALRKISSSEAGDLRDLYAKELAAVRAERAQDREDALKVEVHLRTIIADSDRRHEECESARVEDRRERSKLQREMDEMHAEIAGLKRQIAANSADRVIRLEPNDAPHAEASAERVKKITEGK